MKPTTGINLNNVLLGSVAVLVAAICLKALVALNNLYYFGPRKEIVLQNYDGKTVTLTYSVLSDLVKIRRQSGLDASKIRWLEDIRREPTAVSYAEDNADLIYLRDHCYIENKKGVWKLTRQGEEILDPEDK